MNEEKDLELSNFLNKLREKLKRLVEKYPISTLILAIAENKVSIYVQDTFNHCKLSKVYYTKIGKRLISHMINCDIQEPPDYDLPMGFKVKEGVAYYLISESEVKKI